VKIRVNPAEVKLPAFLPDTPLVRQDWAEYLAAIEAADRFVGEGLAALRDSGQEKNTLIIFLGDHGPTFQHGKMTLYDLGLRTPLIVRLPGQATGVRTDALASAVDVTPTLLDLLGLPALPQAHGVSLRSVLEARPGAVSSPFSFATISNLGPLPNNGMQERSVCDGRWHLIYRENLSPPVRQVQADSKDAKPWGNRTYAETVRVKERFPEPFRILREMDPQSLGGSVPALELYDLQSDPDEMNNLASSPSARVQLERLYNALRNWTITTKDPAVHLPEIIQDLP
jgi:N-sulfoglucosamine sulfohydrolase